MSSDSLPPIIIMRILRELGKFPEVVAELRENPQLFHVLHNNADLVVKMVHSPDARSALARLRAMAAALRIVAAPQSDPAPAASPLNMHTAHSDPSLAARHAFTSMIASIDPKNPPAFTAVAAQAIENPRKIFLFGETADKVQDAVQTLVCHAPSLIKEIIRCQGKFPAPEAPWILELEHEFFHVAARNIVRPVCAGAVDSLRRQQAISSGTERALDITPEALDALLEKNKDVGATFLLDTDGLSNRKAAARPQRPK